MTVTFNNGLCSLSQCGLPAISGWSGVWAAGGSLGRGRPRAEGDLRCAAWRRLGRALPLAPGNGPRPRAGGSGRNLPARPAPGERDLEPGSSPNAPSGGVPLLSAGQSVCSPASAFGFFLSCLFCVASSLVHRGVCIYILFFTIKTPHLRTQVPPHVTVGL